MEINATTAFFLDSLSCFLLWFPMTSELENHFLGVDTIFMFTVHTVIVLLKEAFRQLARKASGQMRRMSKGVALIWNSSKNYPYVLVDMHGFPSDIFSIQDTVFILII